MDWPRLECTARNVLVSVGSFAVAIGWIAYVVSWQTIFIERLFAILICPLMGIAIGAGIGALFGSTWRGVYLGIVIQFCGYFVALVAAFAISAYRNGEGP